MYGFRPARNRKHPGDSPPKWAPIGKTGRLVLLGTVIVGIIIALVILTTRTAGATDDTEGATTMAGPSSPPESSQRVEVREASYAVTFPQDWAVEIVEEGFDRSILVLAQPEAFGPGVELRCGGPSKPDVALLPVAEAFELLPLEPEAGQQVLRPLTGWPVQGGSASTGR